MTCAIITVGDELLIGQVVDMNSAWLASSLSDVGVVVASMVTVPDDTTAIADAITSSLKHADLVIITGGLGPTHDDVTRDGVAKAFGLEFDYREDVFQKIAERFRRRGRQVPDSNKSQAMIPRGFEVLDNEMGSAPGLWSDVTIEGKEASIAVLPGVPREMKWLYTNALKPRLLNRGVMNGRAYRTFSTTGIGESNFQDVLQPFLTTLSDEIAIAYLPNLDGVRLRIGVPGTDPEDAVKSLDHLEEQLKEVAGQYIFSTGDSTLEETVVNLLRNNGITIAIAESCTGGLIASRLTDVSGSSAVLVGGVVAYSNDVKSNIVGVKRETLLQFGAVSSEVASQMATGIRQRFNANIGLATTGIMGPGGGSETKPVGTVWFGIDDGVQARSLKIVMGTERLGNKRRTSTAALNLVRRTVLKMASH